MENPSTISCEGRRADGLPTPDCLVGVLGGGGPPLEGATLTLAGDIRLGCVGAPLREGEAVTLEGVALARVGACTLEGIALARIGAVTLEGVVFSLECGGGGAAGGGAGLHRRR